MLMNISPFPARLLAPALCLLSAASFPGAARAGAGGPTATAVQPAEAGPFERGAWEAEAGAGEFCSFSTTSAKRPTVDYQLEDVRLGIMYDSPRHAEWLHGLLRGNTEFLLEGFGGPVTDGPGTYLAGVSVLGRYNFIQPGSRWIPYLQGGAGILDNDIFKSHPQREVGEAFEFELQADLGVRYLINEKWSISAEAGYRHVSNADLASRNQGLNSLGGLLQASYHFH